MKTFLFWSLKQKLFFIILLTIIPSLLLYAWMTEGHFLDALHRQFDDRLSLISDYFKATMPLKRMLGYTQSDMATVVYKKDLAQLRNFVRTYNLDRLTLTNPEDRICMDSRHLPPGALFILPAHNLTRPRNVFFSRDQNGRWHKAYTQVLFNSYRLRLSAGSQMFAVINKIRRRQNTTLLFGSLLAMVASWFFVSLLSRRLSKLTRGFTLLQSGVDRPVIAVKGHDEIAYLLRAFNETVEKLKLRQDQINVEHETRLANMKILAAGVAHEIRNPLAGISSIIDLIDHDHHAGHEENIPELLDRIRQEISRMNVIIQGMMDYARQPNLHLEKTDIPALLREMQQEDHNCLLQVSAPLPEAMLDRQAIHTVLRNFIINAREASGPDAPILLGGRTGRRHVYIYVKDQGPGISLEAREKLFTPFNSSKARRSGLGLAIAKNIIAAHHGRITCRSSSRGSLFVLIFHLSKELPDGHLVID